MTKTFLKAECGCEGFIDNNFPVPMLQMTKRCEKFPECNRRNTFKEVLT